MRVTLRDIASHTGISLGTVSRFLNGESVRPANREKLEAAMRELGYEENVISLAKRTGSSMTVAVVLSVLNAEFFMRILAALDNRLGDHMFSLLLCNFHKDPDLLVRRLEDLRHRTIDGVVLFPSGLEGNAAEHLRAFTDSKIPVVVIDEFVHGLETDAVVIDNRHSTFRATEHLLHQGHRRIGFLTGRDNSFVAQDRYQGCRDAFAAYDVPWDESLVLCADFNMEKARRCFDSLMNLPDPPTAVFPTSYDMTMGALLSIANRHISIPRDVSLFGYDRFSGTDAFLPKLTLIEQPVARIGETAASILLRRIRGDWDDFPRITKLKTKMVVRDSVAKLGR